MKKITVLILFFLLSTALISCTNFTPGPMNLDVKNPEGQLDFCKDDPAKCLENTEPTFCEQYYGVPCCIQGLSDDARCTETPPSLTELVEICSKDSKNPWCPTYEICKSAETPSDPMYAICKAIVPFPTPPTYCKTRYQGSDPLKHNGLDIASNSGSLPTNDMPINASWKGKVVRSGKDNETGLGNLIVVEYKYEDIPAAQRPEWLKSGNSIYIRYAHLSDKDRIPLGEIGQGTMIGRVGSTGNSTGPHIHLETKSGPSDAYNSFDGIPMYHDPLDVFPGICTK